MYKTFVMLLKQGYNKKLSLSLGFPSFFHFFHFPMGIGKTLIFFLNPFVSTAKPDQRVLIFPVGSLMAVASRTQRFINRFILRTPQERTCLFHNFWMERFVSTNDAWIVGMVHERRQLSPWVSLECAFASLKQSWIPLLIIAVGVKE